MKVMLLYKQKKQLESKNHSIFTENVFMSALFVRQLVEKEKGPSSCVRQFEVHDNFTLDSVQNTLKVAALEGDRVVKDLVAIAYNDSKSV